MDNRSVRTAGERYRGEAGSRDRRRGETGKALAVFNVDRTVHAIHNTCIHWGGPLGERNLVGSVVTCPWHGWQFNVTTGACVANPSAKVERYEVQLEGTA
ncbi:MAG: Rieske (2Fe-2S) protein [Nitrospiraceae bacterium]|nr:Rieske (2Fe-2S) protein [Nitrospiraceae bacterium]